MKIALISLTKNGKILANSILTLLKDDPTVIRVDTFHKNVKETLNDIFNYYDCIIGIMATGIMVRNICGLIKNKKYDPAVLIIDENGQHVISLISGHLGGGNEYSTKIANIIGGKPIITTSTDINHKLGVDSFARKYYLDIDDVSKIKEINTDLINDENVQISFNHKFNFIMEDYDLKKSYQLIPSKSNLLTVSNRSLTINLEPKKIVVGIGSRKNIDSNDVINAVKSALKLLDIPLKRIDAMATGQMKQNENGIINASLELGIPLEIIPEDLLKDFKSPYLNGSDFVMKKFGVQGVCEPSSLIAAGDKSTLIFRKTAYNGVTVALAVSKKI